MAVTRKIYTISHSYDVHKNLGLIVTSKVAKSPSGALRFPHPSGSAVTQFQPLREIILCDLREKKEVSEISHHLASCVELFRIT